MSDETHKQLPSSATMDEAYEAHEWGAKVLVSRDTLTQEEWDEIQKRLKALSEERGPDGNVNGEYADLATLVRIHWKLFQGTARKLLELEHEVLLYMKKRPGSSEQMRPDEDACLHLLSDLVTMTAAKLRGAHPTNKAMTPGDAM